MGRQTSTEWKKVFSSQYHSPDDAVIASFFLFRHGAINLQLHGISIRKNKYRLTVVINVILFSMKLIK